MNSASSLPIPSDRTGRLVLGTAQLGMAYGVMNRNEQPSVREVLRLFASAHDGGIHILDTAQSYGNSEELIARHRQACPDKPFDVVTKLDATIDFADKASVMTAVERSCKRVGRPLHGLLLHHPKYLADWTETVGPVVAAVEQAGYAENIGISVYEPDEFAAALEIEVIRFIQAPFNALDRRLLTSGLLHDATKCGKTVFLRSIFLQGILAATREAVPKKLASVKPVLESWYELCERHGLAPFDAALGYVLARTGQAYVIVGCETTNQLLMNLRSALGVTISDTFIDAVEELEPAPLDLIDPRLWAA